MISCLLFSLLFISCNGNDSGILGLPWGIDYSKAKEIVSKKEIEIKEERTNLSEDEVYQKYGLISSFDVTFMDDDSFLCFYTIIFHSNKFAGADIRLGYIPNVDEDVLSPDILINKIKANIIKKYGNPKEETTDAIKWEKNGLYIDLIFRGFNFLTLTYNNENYYNKKILTRYKMIEDTWLSENLTPEKNTISDATKTSGGFWVGTFDYPVYKITINKDKIIFETYNKNIYDPSVNELLSSEEPKPYIISNNKIVVTDESGNKIEYEYTLNKNVLKMIINNKEIKFERFP